MVNDSSGWKSYTRLMKALATLIFLASAAVFSLVLFRKSPPEMPAPSPLPTEETAETISKESEEPAIPLSLSFIPESAIQGEPVLIMTAGVADLADIDALTLGDQSIPVFKYQGKPAAFLAIDLHKKPGPYEVALVANDGRKTVATIEVKERILPVSDFDIPESFGGNTPAGEKELTSNLETDTTTLNAVTAVVSPEKLWDGAFRHPLDGPVVVTDTYGYSRQTGNAVISHNGTDFRAAVGTPVYAMNAGKVAFAGTFRNYGNTVIIDHGLGVMTMYMHLSELKTESGTPVEKSDLVALSGNTGYSLGPHLHLSVRIYGYSIDPIKFLELMGPK